MDRELIILFNKHSPKKLEMDLDNARKTIKLRDECIAKQKELIVNMEECIAKQKELIVNMEEYIAKQKELLADREN